MKNDLSTKILNYLNRRNIRKNKHKQNLSNNINIPNITGGLNENYFFNNFQNDNKKDLFDFNLNNKNISSSLFKDNLISNNERNVKEDNNTLFLEIKRLKEDIDLYQSRLNELTIKYNKLKEEYQENLLNNYSFGEINLDKNMEEEFIKLEEGKYNIKLNQVINKNNLLKQRNEKIIKHNEQMKKFYKIYTGKDWVNSDQNLP